MRFVPGPFAAKTTRNPLRRRAAIALTVCALAVLPATSVRAASAEPVRATDVISVDPGRGEFTLVLVPDTQRYALHNPAMFFSQTHWIRDNRDGLNIRFVIHLGDIVDDNTDREWRVADEAMGVLDAHVPYMVVPGN